MKLYVLDLGKIIMMGDNDVTGGMRKGYRRREYDNDDCNGCA